MKNALLFSIFIVFAFVNILSFHIVDKSNLSLHTLTALAQDPFETGGQKYTCETSSWTEQYERCADGTLSLCNYISIDCWESPNGMYDESMNCSIITCTDCVTGLSGTVYSDC